MKRAEPHYGRTVQQFIMFEPVWFRKRSMLTFWGSPLEWRSYPAKS